MIISRTPFRISFFGGGTDYPAWYRTNGGQVLATTIDKYCYLTCRYLPPFFDHRFTIAYSKIETCSALEQIQHPAVRGILRHLKLERGVAIKHDADLPARSGMGTSSAFTVGLLHALHALKGELVSKQELAKEAIYVEQEILGETVGSQDQVLAAIGGLNHIVFHPNNEISVRPMTLSQERTAELGEHLMLFYTGLKRTASVIAASYVPRRESAQPNEHPRAAELERLGRLVEEGIQVLKSGTDIRRFGELLHEAWLAKQQLSPLVSNPYVRELYGIARRSGAIGGKLVGAGGGGFMLLFVPPQAQPEVRRALRRFIHVPFKFEFSGSQIIFFDPEADYTEEEKSRAGEPIEPFSELAPYPSTEV